MGKPGFVVAALACGVLSAQDWRPSYPVTDPGPRVGTRMAFDAARGELVMFGGFDPTFGYLADTWIFSGNNWSQAAPATPPTARGLTMMAYDSTNSRYLAFAGTNSFFTPWEDTWAYAAGQWTQLATQRSPSTRRGGGAAWFAPLNRFVIYSAEYLSQANLKSTAMWEFGQNLASFIRFGPSECPAIDPPVLRAYQSQPALGTTFEARVESFLL